MQHAQKTLFLRTYRQVLKISRHKLPFHLRLMCDQVITPSFRLEWERSFNPNYVSAIEKLKMSPHVADSVSTLVTPHFDEDQIQENLKEFLTRWTDYYYQVAALELNYKKVPKGTHMMPKTAEDQKFLQILNEAFVIDHEVRDFMIQMEERQAIGQKTEKPKQAIPQKDRENKINKLKEQYMAKRIV